MNIKWLIIFLICFSGASVYSQIQTKHYIEMSNIVKDSLLIDNAYVSDTIYEHDLLAWRLYNMGIKMELPLVNPYEELHSEYSEILHSNFKNIECMNGYNTNLIYFSFPEDSYVSVYAFLGVTATNCRYIFPFPMWGYYREWYIFIFQIKDDNVILIEKNQFFEM